MQSKCHYCKKPADDGVLMNIGGEVVPVCFSCDEEFVTNELEYR